MAILDKIGTTLISGNQAVINGTTVTFTSYIVEKCTAGDVNVESEDIDNEDGALTSRLIFKRQAKANINLISKTGALPLTDFPMGNMCNYGVLTTHFVDSCSIERSKSAERTSITLTNIGITKF